MFRLFITATVVFFQSVVLAQSLLTDSQKIDYCKGVSASQIAIISTILRDDGISLSLSQIKISAISEATKIKNISEITRMGIVAHTNNFEEQHIIQMKRKIQEGIRQKNLDLAEYRNLFKNNIPKLMIEKYNDCRGEIK